MSLAHWSHRAGLLSGRAGGRQERVKRYKGNLEGWASGREVMPGACQLDVTTTATVGRFSWTHFYEMG